ncbi:unnamed protein product [Amoebophrya sp. A25]|nr:unnamed protein product [Amoebophrya sp. A25]|eukprot:GSA25T00018364001.1
MNTTTSSNRSFGVANQSKANTSRVSQGEDSELRIERGGARELLLQEKEQIPLPQKNREEESETLQCAAATSSPHSATSIVASPSGASTSPSSVVFDRRRNLLCCGFSPRRRDLHLDFEKGPTSGCKEEVETKKSKPSGEQQQAEALYRVDVSPTSEKVGTLRVTFQDKTTSSSTTSRNRSSSCSTTSNNITVNTTTQNMSNNTAPAPGGKNRNCSKGKGLFVGTSFATSSTDPNAFRGSDQGTSSDEGNNPLEMSLTLQGTGPGGMMMPTIGASSAEPPPSGSTQTQHLSVDTNLLPPANSIRGPGPGGSRRPPPGAGLSVSAGAPPRRMLSLDIISPGSTSANSSNVATPSNATGGPGTSIALDSAGAGAGTSGTVNYPGGGGGQVHPQYGLAARNLANLPPVQHVLHAHPYHPHTSRTPQSGASSNVSKESSTQNQLLSMTHQSRHSTTYASAASTLARFCELGALQANTYDYYIFDFDNVLSSVMLGQRKSTREHHRECRQMGAVQMQQMSGGGAPGDFERGPAQTPEPPYAQTIFSGDIEEVSVREFGGQERVLLLQELFVRLLQRGKQFWILSRGREARIKVALRNVNLLRFFEHNDPTMTTIREMSTAGASTSSSSDQEGTGIGMMFSNNFTASNLPPDPSPVVVPGRSPVFHTPLASDQGLGPVPMLPSPVEVDGHASLVRHVDQNGVEDDGNPMDLLQPLSPNTAARRPPPSPINPDYLSVSSNTPFQTPLSSTFDIRNYDARGRILASDTLHRPRGMYKGDQIMNLLKAKDNSVPPTDRVLFIDDNEGNLELARDNVTVYQPRAGMHGTGMSLVEIRYLIAALDDMSGVVVPPPIPSST